MGMKCKPLCNPLFTERSPRQRSPDAEIAYRNHGRPAGIEYFLRLAHCPFAQRMRTTRGHDAVGILRIRTGLGNEAMYDGAVQI